MADPKIPDWVQQTQPPKVPDWVTPQDPGPQMAPISFEDLAGTVDKKQLPNPDFTTGVPFIDWPAGGVDAMLAGGADLAALLRGAFMGGANAMRGEITVGPDGMYRLQSPMEIFSEEATRGQDWYKPNTEAGSFMYDFVGDVISKFVSKAGDIAFDPIDATGVPRDVLQDVLTMGLPAPYAPEFKQEPGTVSTGSPGLGAAAVGVATLATIGIGEAGRRSILSKGRGAFDAVRGTPGPEANPAVWSHYFKLRFPKTFERVKNSAVGKVRVSAKGSVWKDLDAALNEELKDVPSGLNVSDMSVRQKMLMAFHKFDPDGQIPLDTKQKLIEKYLDNVREFEISVTSKVRAEGAGDPDVIDAGTDALKKHRAQLKTEPVLGELPPVAAGVKRDPSVSKVQPEDLLERGKTEPTIGAGIKVYRGTTFYNHAMHESAFVTTNKVFAENWAHKISDPKIREYTVHPKKIFDFRNPAHVEDVLSDPGVQTMFKFEGASMQYARERVTKGDWQYIEEKGFQDVLKQKGYDAFYIKEAPNASTSPTNPLNIGILDQTILREFPAGAIKPSPQRSGPGGKQKGMAMTPTPEDLVDLAARLGRTLDDPILPMVAAGIVRPAPGEGLIRVYKPTSLASDSVKAGDTVYLNPEVAAEQAALRGDTVGGSSVVSAEVPVGEVFKYGSNKFVHAPAGTDIRSMPGYIDRDTGKVTTMGDLLDRAIKGGGIVPGGSAAAAKLRRIYDDARKQEEAAYGHYERKIGRELFAAMVDHAGDVKGALLAASGKEGRNAVREFELIAGTPVKAMRRYQKAYASIFKGLNKADMDSLDEVLNSRRTIQIDTYRGAGKVKHMGGMTGEEAKVFLNDMRSKDPKRFDMLYQKADEVFSVYRAQLDEMLTEGLITPESYKKMANFDYEPRRYLEEFLDDIDPVTTYDKTINPLSVRDSGIQDLAEGKQDFQILNARALLAETISRGQQRIAKNRANKALHTFAISHPDAQFVKAPSATKFKWDERGNLQSDVKVPSGYIRLDAKIDGKAHPIFLEKWLAEQWATRPKAMAPIMEDMMRFMSGTMFVRPLATTYNPAFAITNLPRDTLTAWMNTDTWSPHLPVTIGQMGRDYFSPEVLKGAFGRKGDLLERYFEEGGGQDFLTHQGRNFLSGRRQLPGEMLTKNPRIEHVKDFLSYLNESSELWTRLAMTRRLEAKGLTSRDAVWESRRWLDYAQGGIASKGIDTFIPFFNATMQAWRGSFRSAKERPVQYAEKTAWAGGLLFYNAVSQIMADPQGWQEMSTADKINRATIWTGQYTVDDQGNKRRMYVTLPIDQALIPLRAAMVATLEKQMFGKVPDEMMMKALSQMSQLIPAGQFPVPMANALGGYWSNHDFWRDDAIWKGGDVSSYMEYVVGGKDPTPELWKQFGRVTDFSPEKSRYFTRSLVPDNAWLGMAGMGWSRTFGEVPAEAARLTDMELMARAPFAKRVVKLTHPINREAEEIPKYIHAENDRQKLQNDTMTVMTQQNKDALRADPNSPAFTKAVDTVGSWMANQPSEDQTRLAKAFVMNTAFDHVMRKVRVADDVPSRYWWYKTTDADPQARAAAYYDRWVSAGPEGRKQMDVIAESMDRVTSRVSSRLKSPMNTYVTEAFLRELARLKRERGDVQR